LEWEWMYLARRPLPVPFSPWIKTGKSVARILLTMCLIGCMAGERPKIISSEGTMHGFGTALALATPDTDISNFSH
jgi:hypothetical protein